MLKWIDAGAIVARILGDPIPEELITRHRLALETEARAMLVIEHPNVARLVACERAGDAQFVAMEFIEGRPLSDLLAGQAPPLLRQRAISLVIGALDGLAACHRSGIVHGRLEPSNLHVSTSEPPRLMILDIVGRHGPDAILTELFARCTRAGPVDPERLHMHTCRRRSFEAKRHHPLRTCSAWP
jgi:serine/threonine protein kinase